MLDHQLYRLIIQVVNAQLLFATIPGVTLDQSYQPVRQGAKRTASAYVEKLFDIRDGYPKEEYLWDGVNEIKTMTQQMRSSFQVTALNTPQPGNNTQYTASDIANLIAATLQSDTAIEMFNAGGAGVLNITEVRNPKFLDDSDQWESSPSFDFVLAHKQILIGTSPATTDVTFNIYEV